MCAFSTERNRAKVFSFEHKSAIIILLVHCKPPVTAYAKHLRASSSVGQSWRLITAWSRVQVLAGPLKTKRPAYPAGRFCFFVQRSGGQARLEQGGEPQLAKTVLWTVFSPRVILAGPPKNKTSGVPRRAFCFFVQRSGGQPDLNRAANQNKICLPLSEKHQP